MSRVSSNISCKCAVERQSLGHFMKFNEPKIFIPFKKFRKESIMPGMQFLPKRD